MSLSRVLIVCIALTAGFAAGVFFDNNEGQPCKTDYQYINFRLACQDKPVIDKKSYAVFQNDLEIYLNSQIRNQKLTDVAVYFRDLQNGPIFGINENKQFISASLLKVPIAMSFLKLAEADNPQILERRVVYDRPFDTLPQDIAPEKSITLGETYSIEELLRRMLVYSDNQAAELLKSALKSLYSEKDILRQTYGELGLIIPQTDIEQDISVRAYSSLFRLLYNASYLSQEMSEKLFSWLVDSYFEEGLVAGVPDGISIANKFGERRITYLGDDGSREEIHLHDCGIIYYPQNPYLLCIMTKGQNFNDLSQVIGTLSRMIYEEFSSRKL